MLSDRQLRSFVVEQLDAIGAKPHGEDMQILCPFHDDTTPSLNVHVGHKITPGSYNCFACKAHGSWNSLARALRLPLVDFSQKPVVNEDDNPFIDLLEDIKKAKKVDKKRTLNGLEEVPKDFKWRGYSGGFFKELGAKYFWNRKQDQEYLHFDLNINGTYLGYTLCAINPQDPRIQKYQTFAEAKKVLFLYDKIPPYEPIVLVEGHFDALRLFAEGIYATAIFGTQNWSSVKKNLIVAKNPRKILILMDGDQAGYEAAVQIYEEFCLGWSTDKVHIHYLPPQNPSLDPGNMPDSEFERVRSLIDA